MQLFAVVSTALALLAAPVFGAPTTVQLKEVERVAGKVKPSSYIVKLKSGVSKADQIAQLQSEHSASAQITHDDWAGDLLNGFAGTFGTDALNALRANPDVEAISEDGIVTIAATVTQTDAPWGLARLSSSVKLANQNTSALTFSYTYDDSAGEGVDIYIVDTGIYTDHSDFGGRARWGATFGGYADADGNGHGTHCAGTSAGTHYGVAKKASLIAVKVLDDGGSGAWSDVISGLDWVSQQAAASGHPSIASLSLSGGGTATVDSAITALVNTGVHVTVAAGNFNDDANNYSPARAPAVITVGASTIADARASFSNYGSVVDIFAPGQNVISAWRGSVNATNNISGTSMATPHVAGLIASLITRDGNDTPAAYSDKLKALANQNVLTGIPAGTINALARN
ncbi:serine protease [Fomes fomentarius]|nr:serine protease [Fomes fomentarius]